MKLSQMLTVYSKAPILRSAILRAIGQFGDDADAILVSGQPSRSRNSNCFKSAKAHGFNSFAIFSGPKRRYRSEGHINVVVKIY